MDHLEWGFGRSDCEMAGSDQYESNNFENEHHLVRCIGMQMFLAECHGHFVRSGG